MDAGLTWTIIGSVAGVVAVPAAVVIGVLQLRQGRKGDGKPLRGGGEVLPPSVGRLPVRVRGRDGLVGELAGLAEAPDGRVHVLTGLGGSGKSTVALAAARQAGRAGRRVWWVPAADPASVTATLLGLAQSLGTAAGEVQEAGRTGLTLPTCCGRSWRRLGDGCWCWTTPMTWRRWQSGDGP